MVIGQKSNQFWSGFCIVPVPTGTTLAKDRIRKSPTYIGVKEGHFDERVFGDFSKTSQGLFWYPLFSGSQPLLDFTKVKITRFLDFCGTLRFS